MILFPPQIKNILDIISISHKLKNKTLRKYFTHIGLCLSEHVFRPTLSNPSNFSMRLYTISQIHVD